MKRFRVMRVLATLVSGAIMLQLPGCQDATLLDFIQTALLGITAAGAVAIIENV
jgi:hypothetical protein